MYGFRNVKFESDIASCKDLVLLERDGNIEVYHRTTDNLQMSQYNLKEIAYVFYGNKLADIILAFPRPNYQGGLIDTLFSQFGKGEKDKIDLDKYRWKSKKVVIVYDENPFKQEATLLMMSIPMNRIKTKAVKKSTL